MARRSAKRIRRHCEIADSDRPAQRSDRDYEARVHSRRGDYLAGQRDEIEAHSLHPEDFDGGRHSYQLSARHSNTSALGLVQDEARQVKRCDWLGASRSPSYVRYQAGGDGASGRLRARPPAFAGLSRKSPTVAPSGRVRMKAAQNSVTRDTSVRRYRTTMTASPPANTSAPPW